ncbi:MAG: acyltransferase family protein [Achromobacter pestifer]
MFVPTKSTSNHGLAFSPIVDVLRALSVLAVVAYHAGVPGIPGGYVGVDVFFVISGFLIIGQIVAEHQRGGFSYAGFWARRALRILPAYLLVILASALIALYVLVMPGEFREFGKQVAWSAGMVVNHLFLNEQGYFDTAATSKPLLHLWSLAVEEQFYLFAPLILGLLCWLAGPRFGRVGRSVVTVIVSAMFAVSLWLCIRYTGADDDAKNYAFYLMPLRAWEFILGGIVPFLLPLFRRWSQGALMLLMLAGLGLILFAIFGFSEDTAFPSWNALIPALGATLVIASGQVAPQTMLVRALATRPVLWIGLVSYAWYLWHWPLMAFMRIYNFGELPLAWGVGAGLLSLLLAALTYHFIERPIKDWRKRTKLEMGLKPIAVGVAACVVVAFAGQGLAKTLSANAKEAIPTTMLPKDGTDAKYCKLVGMKSPEQCLAQLSESGRRKLGIVIGDSHARAAYREMRKYGKKKDASTMTLMRISCTPLQDVILYNSAKGTVRPCHGDKKRAFAWLENGTFRPDYAVVYGRWNSTTPWRIKKGADGSVRRPLGYVGESAPAKNQKAIFIDKTRELVSMLNGIGVKRVLFIGPTPEFYGDVWACAVRADHYGKDRDKYCSMPLERVNGRREFSIVWLRKALQGVKGTRLVDPVPAFCDNQMCRGADGNVTLYRDDDHISDAGMRKIMDYYEDDFAWLVDG